jgi:hypothetical protein
MNVPILTVTLNPPIDGEAGRGAINVARVLKPPGYVFGRRTCQGPCGSRARAIGKLGRKRV